MYESNVLDTAAAACAVSQSVNHLLGIDRRMVDERLELATPAGALENIFNLYHI